MDKTILVRMARMGVTRDHVKLKTTLGSCIGVILFDKKACVSGIVHIMLPEKIKNDNVKEKYADTGIPSLLKKVEKNGGKRTNIKACVIGGANMFQYSGEKKITTIGEKNIEKSKSILKELNIPIVFEDTGGNCGRTVIFNSVTFKVSVKTLKGLDERRENN